MATLVHRHLIASSEGLMYIILCRNSAFIVITLRVNFNTKIMLLLLCCYWTFTSIFTLLEPRDTVTFIVAIFILTSLMFCFRTVMGDDVGTFIDIYIKIHLKYDIDNYKIIPIQPSFANSKPALQSHLYSPLKVFLVHVWEQLLVTPSWHSVGSGEVWFPVV